MPVRHPICHMPPIYPIIPWYAPAHDHGMPGMPRIRWYNAKLTEGRIGSCANLYTGTVICPFSSPFWPIFRDRFPLLSTRFPQLCKTGPLDSTGTLTVFFITFPWFEYPDISRSEIYICRFSAKIRLEMAEKRLKTAQKHLKTDQFCPIWPSGVPWHQLGSVFRGPDKVHKK